MNVAAMKGNQLVTTNLRGADIVVESLISMGVEYIAGVPGHTVIDLVDALRLRQDRITAIPMRNEEAAGYLADVYYRTADKPMAIFAHSSVGAANLLTGVMNAMLDSSAMIVITGNVWTRNQGRGGFQELSAERDAGTADIFRGSVKRSWQVNRADKLAETLIRAHKEAISGRPGPVHIDITQDAFAERIEVELPGNAHDWVPTSRIRGERAATERAFELLTSSPRPVILAGGGTVRSRAGAALLKFAEATGIPVATTAMGKGVFPDSHPLSLGVSGWVGTRHANEALRNADVILALGVRFSETDTAGWTDGAVFNIPQTRLVQIDIDPVEIARHYPVAEGIVADAASALEDLLELQAGASAERPDLAPWFAQIDAARAEWKNDLAAAFDPASTPIEPGRVVQELRKALPEDGILVTDVGNSQKWYIQQFPIERENTFVTSVGGASMGFGPGGVAGAQLANPGKRVVNITGDGSLAMSLHMLPNLVELGLPIVIVVHNDYAWASVNGPQQRRFGAEGDFFTKFKTPGTDSYRLDFAAIAQAAGMQSERVSDPADLEAAFQRAFAANAPYLVDVEVRRDTYVPMTGGGAYPLPKAE